MPIQITNFNPHISQASPLQPVCRARSSLNSLDINSYLLHSISLDAPSVLRFVTQNWKDCIIIAGIALAVIACVSAFFVGQTLFFIGLAFTSGSQILCYHYMKKYETLQTLIGVAGNLREENNRLALSNADLQQQVNNLHKEILGLVSACETLQKHNQEFAQNNNDLKNNIKKLKALQKPVEELNLIKIQLEEDTKKLEGLTKTKEALEHDVEKLTLIKDELESIQKDFKETQKRHENIVNLTEECDKLRKKVAEQETELKKLRTLKQAIDSVKE